MYVFTAPCVLHGEWREEGVGCDVFSVYNMHPIRRSWEKGGKSERHNQDIGLLQQRKEMEVEEEKEVCIAICGVGFSNGSNK